MLERLTVFTNFRSWKINRSLRLRFEDLTEIIVKSLSDISDIPDYTASHLGR
jgi:hypothetical protein